MIDLKKISLPVICKSVSMTVLVAAVCLILLFGIGLSVLVVVKTSLNLNLFSMELCFENKCISEYFDKINQAAIIAKATVDLEVAVATVGGIFVALLSYFNSSSNAALANHIEHLKVFVEYVDSEIKKRNRLSEQTIDKLLLYSTIFSQSRRGRTTVSTEFVRLVEGLNEIILESNQRCEVGTPGGFSYKDHQRRVRDHLAGAGIEVYLAPRNDYFEMEEQLFSLLHRIGQSFCNPGALPNIVDRLYR